MPLGMGPPEVGHPGGKLVRWQANTMVWQRMVHRAPNTVEKEQKKF